MGSCAHAMNLLVCFMYPSSLLLLLSLDCAQVWCRGGNVPFRRLCASFGADATMSEMSYARNLIKGNVVERTHLRQAANEHCFGEHVRCIISAHAHIICVHSLQIPSCMPWYRCMQTSLLKALANFVFASTCYAARLTKTSCLTRQTSRNGNKHVF